MNKIKTNNYFTASELIKRFILTDYFSNDISKQNEILKLNNEEIVELYEKISMEISCIFHDIEDYIRTENSNETGRSAKDHSMHYESREHYLELFGHTVGFTYWYGGGKHGEPNAIDWIDDAYFLEIEEVQKIVKEFSNSNIKEVEIKL